MYKHILMFSLTVNCIICHLNIYINKRQSSWSSNSPKCNVHIRALSSTMIFAEAISRNATIYLKITPLFVWVNIDVFGL